MSLPTNTLLQGGKYKIVHHIASGGFGVTYEAEHVMLHKRLAIKEFFVKDYCNRNEQSQHVTVGTLSKSRLVSRLKRKFIDEAVAICQLSHPNIVRVSDVFEENGTAYYVMDYIDGKSLQQITKEHGFLSEAEAVGYIRQVADALNYVHAQNRLHLDIKPGNIMVSKEGKALLIDFGASKQYDEVDGENTSTLAGKTPGYAPVEQMGNRVQTFNPATDIYSLGATLYKLLTGVTPPDSTEIADDPAVLKPLPASVSPAVRNAVMQAMQTRRKDRPQTIAQFLQLLDTNPEEDEDTLAVDEEEKEEEIIQPKETKVKEEKKEPQVKPSPNGKARQKNRLVWLAIAAAFLITVIVIFANIFSNKTQEATSKPSLDIQEAVDTAANENVTNATFTDASGNTFTYTGQIANGKPNGNGTGIYESGKYAGTYVNGMMQGENGKYVFTSGDIYTGSFVADHFERGRITMVADGMYFDGTFKNGQPYDGKWYDKNGNLYSEVKEGQ